MKHPSSRQFFAYWDAKRGHARAPDRSEIEPSAVRELLGDIFVLGYENEAGFPFRVAGTRVCALLGRGAKDSSFSALFAEESRREIEDIVTYVAEEMLAAVAGITATSEDGRTAHLELLLLPFNNRAHAPISITGLLAPFEDDLGTLKDFRLTSWRYLHRPEKLVPRALRKLAIARGFMVYEGITGR
ncbi:PAS domain-containing protein [Bradyrhizobium sp. AUGA SZCCT0240]|uniref:PAS domain-containing protein n=1 Tax=unclassified Bradyrhizobium TaxID=2631580 RepID=UPI001BA6FDDB|nr:MULTISPECIES: PAS domain-containing protein [unclassified Bradyrhizobium]MBR1198311.1 PAS domain-containing protein [Bradyrhizobium sp. AUGA SZCCT0158]MBR1238956.1 PAS domain-containing protein [Bradyrhizobium sp. AUGA SZCCT0274]MBR1255770.1 PAS domain-containing protein [Bradyrhizobium sp. AUGA SZCCT0240]